MKKIFYIILILFTTTMGLFGCKKYLDEKPDKSWVIPQKIQDMQALLDNFSKINRTGNAAAESSADNYYLSDADYTRLDIYPKRLYTWEKDNSFTTTGANDWANAYDKVFIANLVLDNINDVVKTDANQGEWNDVKGQALFLRANSFLQVASVWTLAYGEAGAASEMGIPLRKNSAINEKLSRSTLRETYTQITSDLKLAIRLLAVKPLHVMRASKPAAYALLARTYLFMGAYVEAGLYADSCLQLKKDLLDFNDASLNPNAVYPFGHTSLVYNNPEIIYASRMTNGPLMNNSIAKIDLTLYNSYAADDLRKSLYYRLNTGVSANTYRFRGSLEGTALLFDGIAADEVYLTRAECYARNGNAEAAMRDLNDLIVKRWRNTVLFPKFTAVNANDALGQILIERRKELVMRGLRWMDIKRLNKTGANISLGRVVNGETYTLAANDLRFALPIPEDVIELSGYPQNKR